MNSRKLAFFWKEREMSRSGKKVWKEKAEGGVVKKRGLEYGARRIQNQRMGIVNGNCEEKPKESI